MQDDDQQGGQEKGSRRNIFKEKLKEHTGAEIQPDVQARLNKPLEEKMADEDRTFLNEVVSKIESKEIDLYAPQSLLNKDIYEGLTPENEQRVDITLQNLLFSLRQIKSWYVAGEQENMQMANMIREVRMKKEKLENEVGDVLKI